MFWRGYIQPSKALETCHGRWIFSFETNRASSQMLTNIFEDIEEDRRRRRYLTHSSNDDDTVIASWLFLKKGADLRALEQLQNTHYVQFLRRWNRYRTCDWNLHCSLKIWHRLFDGIKVRRRRCEMRAANEEVLFNNGAWLFS